MKYKYNGNLEIEDRINDVCDDIKSEYKDIPIDTLYIKNLLSHYYETHDS